MDPIRDIPNTEKTAVGDGGMDGSARGRTESSKDAGRRAVSDVPLLWASVGAESAPRAGELIVAASAWAAVPELANESSAELLLLAAASPPGPLS